jgi:4'-phosphopantetheinyl transferase
MSTTYVNDTAFRSRSHQSRDSADLCLWSAPLDLSASAVGDLATCLSAEEHQRADRYYRPADRTRFVAARGWLRHLLAGQLVCTPAEVRLVKDIRPSSDLDGFAARFFSPAEQRRLSSLAPAQRMVATFQCWTCKEAYGKATGDGLSFPLRTVDTWVGDGRPALVSGWSVEAFAVAPGFVGAVAAGVVRRAETGQPRLTPPPLDVAQMFLKKGGCRRGNPWHR